MYWVSNLKCLAMLAVVFLHVAAPFVTSSPHGDHQWWAGNIVDSITRWSVPFFVMISGYFLLNKNESHTVFMHKRLHRLLRPLIFWTLFYVAWSLLKGEVKGIAFTDSLTLLLKGWLQGKPYEHLWYVYMIPFLYLITPYLRTLADHSSQQAYFWLVVLCFSFAIVAEWAHFFSIYVEQQTPLTIFPFSFLPYIGYYLLGGYVYRYPPKIRLSYCWAAFLLACTVTILGSYYFSYLY